MRNLSIPYFSINSWNKYPNEPVWCVYGEKQRTTKCTRCITVLRTFLKPKNEHKFAKLLDDHGVVPPLKIGFGCKMFSRNQP